MKFKLRHEDLKTALDVVKNSKALSRNEGDDSSVIKITASKDTELIQFNASNSGVYACSNIKGQLFDGNPKKDDIFNIEESGEVFVDGNDFINMIAQYPKTAIITFDVAGTKEKNLKIECIDPDKKGKSRTSSFLVIEPSFFEADPPVETRETVLVNTADLSTAVNSVEFVSGQDEKKFYLWGVAVEVYGIDDIASCASDKVRIAWYDKKGFNRDKTTSPCLFNPIKASFISALKVLDQAKPVKVEYGPRFTILSQDNQWHAIPNAFASHDEEVLPDWRLVTEKLSSVEKHIINIPKALIEDFMKTALAASCGKYGISVQFNTKKKTVRLSVNETKVGAGLLKSTHQIEDTLGSDQIEGEPFEGEFTLSIRGLREVIANFNGEMVAFHLANCDSPVQITDKDSDFRYISSVVK